jgi:hypothetical protein
MTYSGLSISSGNITSNESVVVPALLFSASFH